MCIYILQAKLLPMCEAHSSLCSVGKSGASTASYPGGRRSDVRPVLRFMCNTCPWNKNRFS